MNRSDTNVKSIYYSIIDLLVSFQRNLLYDFPYFNLYYFQEMAPLWLCFNCAVLELPDGHPGRASPPRMPGGQQRRPALYRKRDVTHFSNPFNRCAELCFPIFVRFPAGSLRISMVSLPVFTSTFTERIRHISVRYGMGAKVFVDSAGNWIKSCKSKGTLNN